MGGFKQRLPTPGKGFVAAGVWTLLTFVSMQVMEVPLGLPDDLSCQRMMKKAYPSPSAPPVRSRMADGEPPPRGLGGVDGNG